MRNRFSCSRRRSLVSRSAACTLARPCSAGAALFDSLDIALAGIGSMEPSRMLVRGGYGISSYPLAIQNEIQIPNPPYIFSETCIPCFGSFTWPTLPVPTPSSLTPPNVPPLLTAAALPNVGTIFDFARDPSA